MSEVRITKIKTSLATQMAQPGGRTVVDVERRANERLERHRAEVMATIHQRVSELEQLSLKAQSGTEGQVYVLASAILDTGGFFDTGPFYEAGYSLCEVTDLMTTQNQWHWPSVAVHVQALRLILATGCKANATTDTLMLGLRQIVARVRGE